MTNDTQYHVNESADKIVLKTKLTRGSGTRDQDKFDVKIKGSDPKDVVEKMEQALEYLTDTADDVRAIQPNASE